jgi:hypothetical protein
MVNLISPVQRSRGGASGGGGSAASGTGIPFQGKTAGASIIQTRFFPGLSVSAAGEGTSAGLPRRLGTIATIQVIANVTTFTANIGASNAAKDLTVEFSRQGSGGSPVLDTITVPIPMVGLNNAGTQVGRWGGLVGPLLVVDDDVVSDSAAGYIVEFTAVPSGFAGLTFSLLLQEIRV